MTRIMYDSVSQFSIPSDATMVAGYVDGKYAWSTQDWALRSHLTVVRIAVFASTNNGNVLDAERGDATNSEAVDWTMMRRTMGVIPAIYTAEENWDALKQEFVSRGVAQPYYWVAKWQESPDPKNPPSIPSGAIALQFMNTPGWDMSVVSTFWPGVDSPILEIPVWPGRYLEFTEPPMSGHDVMEWQGKMRQRGWVISVDGIYGPQSKSMCEEFQSEKHLAVDGIVGPITWNATWTFPVTKP